MLGDMKEKLLLRYGDNVPRYTSYPTAAQFHGGVTPKTYAGWLTGIDAKTPVSLYLHVPYCQQVGWYCGGNVQVANKYSIISRYKDLLLAELELVAGHLQEPPDLSHIHWGGGSPNLLMAADFQDLMRAIKKQFWIEPGTDHAMEVDPRTVTEEKLTGYVAAGINRISLGVQDFNPHVQKAINRIQPFSLVKQVVSWIRGAGITGINFDLMYGLPRQSLEDVIRNVDLAASLAPDRLSVFGYAHMPWIQAHQRNIKQEDLPSAQERLKASEAIARRLEENGYVAIGIDHFARPGDPLAKAFLSGTLRRNFQGYTTDNAEIMIGLGASAIGHFPGGFVQNASSVKAYADRIRNGELATSRGVLKSGEDAPRWAIIEKLMCNMKVDLASICHAHDANTGDFAAEMNALSSYEADGLVRRYGEAFEITEAGRPFVRSVAAVFDKYFQTSNARRSRAV